MFQQKGQLQNIECSSSNKGTCIFANMQSPLISYPFSSIPRKKFVAQEKS